MKKLLLGILLTTGISAAFAQQDAQFTHFFRNQLNYNSAFAGSEDGKICATLIGRSQWLGFGSNEIGGSPQSIGGNIHAPLFNGKLGIGLNILTDQQGFEGTLTPTLSAAYHHTFSNQHILSAGVGVGIIQKSLNGKELKAQKQGDPSIPNQLVTGNSMDFNFGLYYKTQQISIFEKAYAGLSATHLNQAEVNYGNIKYTAALHYYLMMGVVYDMGTFTIEPNILLKSAVKTTLDLNVMTTYNGNILGGVTYRTIDAIALLGGYKFSDNSSLMLSYDLTTSKLSQFSNGTVEISYKHCFKFKTEPPVKTFKPIYTPRFL
ncbi:MAG: PorP/SprF family type IX secretion system membrane protein [Bacteroidia bacterium]|nr:PorP/SprF family type IX secretion system membrane protein [Bacteroidia bacterium]